MSIPTRLLFYLAIANTWRRELWNLPVGTWSIASVMLISRCVVTEVFQYGVLTYKMNLKSTPEDAVKSRLRLDLSICEMVTSVRFGNSQIIIAAHGRHARSKPATSRPGISGRGGWQHAALNLGGLRQVALNDAIVLFDLGQPHVLDTGGRHIGHHGEEAQIVLGELTQHERRIHVDQADDAALRLEWNRHHGVDFLFHDAHAPAEGGIGLRIAHQDGRLLLDHAVADGRGNAEALAFVGLGHQLAFFEQHHHAALRADRLDGKIQDDRKQFRQGAIFREFQPGSQQGLHRGRRLGTGAFDGQRLVSALQAGDYGGGAGRSSIGAVEHHHSQIGGFALGRIENHQVSGGDAIARPQNQAGLQWNVVDEGSVFAAEVLDRPLVAFRLKGEVLARKTGIFGKTKLGGARVGLPKAALR